MAFLENILARKYAISASRISPSSRICEDLKLDGDDAIELFDAFHDAFPFDIGNFTYDQYFAPEGFAIGMIDWLRGRKSQSRRDLTLQMLLDAATSGLWQDEKDKS